MENKPVETFLDRVIQWAIGCKSIEALLMTGSRAEKGKVDPLSDYDLSLFCQDPFELVNAPLHLEEIALLWVVIPEQFLFEGVTIPTRLAIFEGGVKVDFAFFPTSLLQQLARSTALPDALNKGYRVLIDKEGLAKSLPAPSYEGFIEKKPSLEEFDALFQEFWFEAYHVAKYLSRQDLWSMQFRLSGLRDLLLRMIRWHEAARHDWKLATSAIGKRMEDWVSEETQQQLSGLFSPFDAKEGWLALSNNLQLFQKLSSETASMLGYAMRVDLEEKMSQHLVHLWQEATKKGNA